MNIQIHTPKGLIITNHCFCHDEIVQSFESSGNKLAEAKTPREAIHDAFRSRPPSTEAPLYEGEAGGVGSGGPA
jgi:hypothetical protein